MPSRFRVQGQNPEKMAVLTDRNAHLVVAGQVVSQPLKTEYQPSGILTITAKQDD